MTAKGFDFVDIARIKWKHRKILLIIFALAAVVSLAFSFLLPIEYKSTAILMPSHTTDLIVGDYGLRTGNLAQIGETEEAEQLLEIMNSDAFLISICKELDLSEHYEISKEDPKARTKLLDKIKSNVKTKRTRFNAVYIEVLDFSPHMAQTIANHMLDQLDIFRNAMTEERGRPAMKYVVSKKDSLNQQLKLLNNEKSRLNAKGVVSKVERAGIYEGWGQNPSTSLRAQIDSNLKYGAHYDQIEKQHLETQNRRDYMDKVMDQLEASYSAGLPHKFDVQRAYLPDKKAKPKRALIVLLGAVGATFIAVVYFVWHAYRNQIHQLLEDHAR